MKKIFQSAVFRALCAIVTGVLLLEFSQESVEWITIVVGAIFFVSGIISCVAYFAMRNSANKELIDAKDSDDKKPLNVLQPSMTMPIVGVASIVLGAMLAVIPDNFHVWFIYILSVLLIIGALGQMFTLVSARKYGSLGWGFWILPIVIFIAPIVIIIYHNTFSSTELILGLIMLLYGCTEIFNAIAIHRHTPTRQ